MKITKIETVAGTPNRGGLLMCRIHTDEGLVGCGESFYNPTVVAAIIHDWMAQRLIGSDPFDVEENWRFFYERATAKGGRGAEMQALSAIDLALWDIKGQAAGMPVWQLLGGKTQPGVRVYRSVGYGPGSNGLWAGYGSVGEEGPYNDYWLAVNRPEEFAQKVLSDGISGAKFWTLDFAAHKPGGSSYVSYDDIEKGLEPLRRMRETVGNKLEMILDGHGFFELPMALRIAEMAKPLKMLALEDILRIDNVDTISDFRAQSRMPLAVSEMLINTEDYRLVLEKHAADYIMIDSTWVGGISQTLKITDFAQAYNVPVIMHDATGPLTLLAALHVGVARRNVAWQETIREHMDVRYPMLVDEIPPIKDGRLLPPQSPGIGTKWHDELFQNTDKLRVSDKVIYSPS